MTTITRSTSQINSFRMDGSQMIAGASFGNAAGSRWGSVVTWPGNQGGQELPVGAVISSATVTFRGYGGGGNTAKSKLYLAKTITPAHPTDPAVAMAIPLTTAFTLWEINPDFSYQEYRPSPNFAAAVQEIVDGAGYTQTQTLQLLTMDDNSPTGINPTGDVGGGAVLEIVFTVPLPGGILAGSTATVSDSASGTPDLTIDGNQTTFWHSNSGDPHWLKFDLGAGNEKSCRNYKFTHRDGADPHSANSWKLSGSMNDLDYDLIDERLLQGAAGGGEVRAFECSTDNPYRFYKWDWLATFSGYVTIAEISLGLNLTALPPPANHLGSARRNRLDMRGVSQR